MVKRVVGRTLVVSAFGLWLGAVPVQAASWFDGFLGSKPDLDSASARSWRLDQFTGVKLVAREASAPPNAHPTVIDAGALAAQLGKVEARVRNEWEPLFDPAELRELAPVMARAFALAGPNDDVQLLSTARRGGTFAAPLAITARLFVTDEGLNVLVNDTRREFMEMYTRTRRDPRFEFGTRASAGRSSVRAASAPSRRSDWIIVPVGLLTSQASAVARPAAAAVPAAAQGPAAAAVPAAPAAPAPVAATVPQPGSPAAAADEIEQRLVTLKRLRDRGLISEEEYQQKRREVLQRL